MTAIPINLHASQVPVNPVSALSLHIYDFTDAIRRRSSPGLVAVQSPIRHLPVADMSTERARIVAGTHAP